MQPDPSSPPPKSPPPRELPRVPGGVSSLATRYEPRQPDSPTQMRPSMDHYPRMPEPSSTASISPSTSRYSAGAPGYSAEEIALRRQRIEELEELELRERAHELRMKERDIEQRTRELERERLQLLGAGGRAGSSTSAVDGYLSDGARGAPPTRTQQQRMSVDARFPSTYSTSTTHLALPQAQRRSPRRRRSHGRRSLPRLRRRWTTRPRAGARRARRASTRCAGRRRRETCARPSRPSSCAPRSRREGGSAG